MRNAAAELELAHKKRREKDHELRLMSKLQELNRQLDAERVRVKEKKKEEEQKTRLIVAANRLPVTPAYDEETGEWHFKRSSGGLVSAFLGVKTFEITWIGWVGVDVPEEAREGIAARLRQQQPFRCIPVWLDEDTADLYYNGFSNNVLWPLLHYIPLSMLDSHTTLAETQWEAYQAANKAFADVILPEVRETDLVWVQDYHLMLLPKYLRDASPQLSIGWFLHTPFATSEMYRTLPHREEILRGILGADLCGFHIYDYVRHFHTSCARVLTIGGDQGITEGNDGIFDHASRRSICVDTFPIGIEPHKFEEALETKAVKDKIIEMQRRFDGKKVLLGIDRLDYVKGLPHKLKALEYFLKNYPQWRGKVVLLQIAVPSRTEVPGYQKLRSNVHRLVSRINGTYGSLDDVPIHYLDQSMGFNELCALYFRADVMFVTSLRDGMNLVSFEFIACQKKRCGVLVLSEFAGAAQALGAGALLINPYNTDDVAVTLHQALNMPQKEREDRFMYMHAHILSHTSQEWAEQFVASLRHARQTSNYDAGPFSELSEAKQLPTHNVVASYKASENSGGARLIVLGLMGTLIDYDSFMNMEPLLPSVRRNLATLALVPNNTVVVCSGRERALMNEWLGDLPIWLVAENGLFIRPPTETGDGAAAWEMLKDDIDNSWMDPLKSIFKYFEARTPGTVTEMQEYTMTWHFNVDNDDFAEVQAGNLQTHLTKVSGRAPVEVGLDMKRVEVRPYGVSKGAALAAILDRLLCTRGGGSRFASANSLYAASESSSESSSALPMASSTALAHAADGSLGERNHFKWVLCVGEVMARDEDLFTTLQGLFDYEDAGVNTSVSERGFDASNSLFTCCVAKTLSQAEYYLEDFNATAGLLDLLAHVTHDAAQLGGSMSPQQPSVLERLPQLLRALVGKQLLFLLDYEGCETAAEGSLRDSHAFNERDDDAASSNSGSFRRESSAGPNRASRSSLASHPLGGFPSEFIKLVTLYPTAVVTRQTAAPEEREGRSESGGGDSLPRDLGEISGVRILPFPRTSSQFGSRNTEDKDRRATLQEQTIDYEASYGVALESCNAKLTEKLKEIGAQHVTIEDNNFSMSVVLRGASDEEQTIVREAVLEMVRTEFPMLRCTEGRQALEVRPDVDWNRAKAAKAVIETVVERMTEALGLRGVLPIYIGQDEAFRNIREVHDGIDILVTGGPAAQSYFLRDVSQVGQLFRWLTEQHGAGVTVRGGKLSRRQPPMPVLGAGSKHEARDWHSRALPARAQPRHVAPDMSGNRHSQ